MTHPQQEREALLHRWVADGKVEVQVALKGGDDQITQYRVPGTKEWWRDEPSTDEFPGIKLIATLALGIMALQPELKPITPQWQHAHGLAASYRPLFAADDDWKKYG